MVRRAVLAAESELRKRRGSGRPPAEVTAEVALVVAP
jgi:hypothetical protein